jgi:hypothetical protein
LAAERVRYATKWVFVDQPAEQVAAADAIEIDHLADRLLACRRRRVERWPLVERAVRPMLVVCDEDMIEVAAADDQDPVEALAVHAPDPALGVRSRLRRPDRSLDHADPVGAEDLVELRGELAVPVTDEKPRADTLALASSCISRLRARWVTQGPSGLVVTPARRTPLLASSMKNNT